MDKLLRGMKILLRDPKKIVTALGRNEMLNWMPDSMYLKLAFYCEIGKKLNITSPKSYNEKLQWIKLFIRNPEYHNYVDKYKVRFHVSRLIGEEYLVPLIGVYEKVEEIPWPELPDQFVLKCTHGSGCNIICKDKNKIDISKAKNNLFAWMKKNWYWYGREYAYKNVYPRIICEKLLLGDNGDLPEDYKIMCFNGDPKLIQVHRGRYSGLHTKDVYDVTWQKTEIVQGPPPSKSLIPRPSTLDQMLEVARVLSKGLPFARIDLYQNNEKVYFGEITLYPTSGFTPFQRYEDDLMLGSWINLPI